MTPLWWAVWYKDEAVIKLLLDIGKVDIEAKGKYGGTLLSYAVQNGDEAD